MGLKLTRLTKYGALVGMSNCPYICNIEDLMNATDTAISADTYWTQTVVTNSPPTGKEKEVKVNTLLVSIVLCYTDHVQKHTHLNAAITWNAAHVQTKEESDEVAYKESSHNTVTCVPDA